MPPLLPRLAVVFRIRQIWFRYDTAGLQLLYRIVDIIAIFSAQVSDKLRS